MTKREYLHQLRTLLGILPEEEADRIIDFYEETIDDHIEAGESEERAVAALESPSAVATRLIEEMPPIPRAVVKTHDRSRVLFWALLILGSPIWLSLAFAGILAAAALYVALWALVLGAWLCTLAMIAGLPLGIAAACIATGMQVPAYAFVQLGIGAAFSGVGLLCLHLSLSITRGIVKATVALSRRIAALFVDSFREEGSDGFVQDGKGRAPFAPYGAGDKAGDDAADGATAETLELAMVGIGADESTARLGIHSSACAPHAVRWAVAREFL